ncbi:MAG: CopD family protein [Acidiferrobacterales bacterium]
MGIALTVHMLAVVIWVGGMFFAYMALRPAAVETLEPSQRLPLWSAAFKRFFPWVWSAIILLPATGYWMILSPSAFDGFANVGPNVHAMQGIGIIMILIFMHVFFAPYQRLNRAVDASDWTEAAKQLNQIRQSVFVNLILGMITIIIATSGAYWI